MYQDIGLVTSALDCQVRGGRNDDLYFFPHFISKVQCKTFWAFNECFLNELLKRVIFN